MSGVAEMRPKWCLGEVLPDIVRPEGWRSFPLRSTAPPVSTTFLEGWEFRGSGQNFPRYRRPES
ncbi:hypothetical protein BDW60DRAFT_202407 [Aspergillus nidulans var. acristatus]